MTEIRGTGRECSRSVGKLSWALEGCLRSFGKKEPTTLPQAPTNQGQPLSSYVDSFLHHAARFATGDRTEDHGTAIVRNVECYARTRQQILDGELPVDLADHAGDAVSEMLTGITKEIERDEAEEGARRGWNSRATWLATSTASCSERPSAESSRSLQREV